MKKIIIGIVALALVAGGTVFFFASNNKNGSGNAGGTNNGKTVSITNEGYKLEMKTPNGWFVDNENEKLQKLEYQAGFVKDEEDIGYWSTSYNCTRVTLKSFDVFDYDKEVVLEELQGSLGYVKPEDNETLITDGIVNKKINGYDVYYFIYKNNYMYWIDALVFFDENQYIVMSGHLDVDEYSVSDLENFVSDVVSTFKLTK